MDLRSRFGNLLAGHRRRLGLTQEALSAATGISPDMLSRIETGGTGVSFKTIEALARALHIDPAQLFVWEPTPGSDFRSPLIDLTARLTKLSDDELLRASEILEVAMRGAPQRTRVSKG